MTMRTVLIADPDEQSATLLAGLIQEVGLTTQRARSPRDVLSAAESGVDALFLDLKAPLLKGGHLLAELRRRQFSAPVVVVSAEASKAELLFAMRNGCIDWIDKPADRAAVTNALKRVARESKRKVTTAVNQAPVAQTRALIREIVDKVREGNIALPEVPSIVAELRRVLSDLTVDSGQVLTVLEKDPSIAARIIATANTATYGGRGKITDLRSAVTRLGNRAIAGIAHSASLRGMFAFRSPAFKQVFKVMWQGQMVAACLSREIARENKIGDPDEIYLLSMMQNAGEPFLLRVFAEIFMRQQNQVLSMEDILLVIREWHPSFGANLLEKWCMGEQFVVVARRHHELEAFERGVLNDPLRKVMHLLNVCNRMVERLGITAYPRPPEGPRGEDSFAVLGIDLERWDEYMARASQIQDDILTVI